MGTEHWPKRAKNTAKAKEMATLAMKIQDPISSSLYIGLNILKDVVSYFTIL